MPHENNVSESKFAVQNIGFGMIYLKRFKETF